MKPYLILQTNKYSHRTSIGVGKEKLNWVINMIFPVNLPFLKITVFDRDLKYDDEVGTIEMKI